MRIAIYHNQLAGGAARVMLAYAQQMHTRHELELFMPTTADTGFIDLKRYVSKIRRFPIVTANTPLGRYRRVLGIRKYGRRIAQAIDAGGFDAVFANMSFVSQSPEILPYLKTPSLYYAPEPLRAVYDPVVEAPPSLRQTIKRIVFAPYDWYRGRFDRRAIKDATAVFTHSYFTKDTLLRTYGVQAEVIHLGVDSKTFRPLNVPRQPFVLSVGAMHPLKGHQFVIDAVATIPRTGTGRPKLVAVGSRGDFGATLKAYAKQQGVDFELRQSVSMNELIKLYNQATVMAAAQFREPFGLITLEAMACGTPVVAVNEGGLTETVRDGVTGLLVQRDPVEFGEAIGRVFRDQDLAQRLGEDGRSEVLKKWRWETTAKEIDQLLEQLAKRGVSPQASG